MDERMSAHRKPQMTCPECGENAQEKPPAEGVNWDAHGITRPRWSHLDGSSLCPVIAPWGGYEPAQPQPLTAEKSAGMPDADTARPEPPATRERLTDLDLDRVVAVPLDGSAIRPDTVRASRDHMAGTLLATLRDLEAGQ